MSCSCSCLATACTCLRLYFAMLHSSDFVYIPECSTIEIKLIILIISFKYLLHSLTMADSGMAQTAAPLSGELVDT